MWGEWGRGATTCRGDSGIWARFVSLRCEELIHAAPLAPRPALRIAEFTHETDEDEYCMGLGQHSSHDHDVRRAWAKANTVP